MIYMIAVGTTIDNITWTFTPSLNLTFEGHSEVKSNNTFGVTIWLLISVQKVTCTYSCLIAVGTTIDNVMWPFTPSLDLAFQGHSEVKSNTFVVTIYGFLSVLESRICTYSYIKVWSMSDLELNVFKTTQSNVITHLEF